MDPASQRAANQVKVQINNPVFDTTGLGAPEADQDGIPVGCHEALRRFHIKEAQSRIAPFIQHDIYNVGLTRY